MQQVSTGFHGLTLHCQLDTPSAAVAAKVVALWTRNRILPPGVSPSERVRQVVIAALAPSGRAVGVNTVYPGTLPLGTPIRRQRPAGTTACS
jgi:hypothetical protein